MNAQFASLLAEMPNPFLNDAFQDPWEDDFLDIAAIHDDVTTQCLNLLTHVRKQKRSASLLITGVAGSGKTHLIARLRKRMQGQKKPVVCWVRFSGAANERSLWGYVRQYLVTDLLREIRGDDGKPSNQLTQLLKSRFPNVFSGQVNSGQSVLDWIASFGQKSFQHRLKEALSSDRQLGNAVRQLIPLLYNEHPSVESDARDFLLGDYATFSDENFERIGLCAQYPTDVGLENQSEALVLSLCRLSSPDCPIVLFFDQMECLQAHANDGAGLKKFGDVFARMDGEAQATMLLIASVRSDYREKLRSTIGQANWDRLARKETMLATLTKWEEHVVPLISQRLSRCAELQEIRKAQRTADAFWPLTKASVHAEFVARKAACTPRTILQACAHLFERLHTTTHASLAEYLTNRWLELRDVKKRKPSLAPLFHVIPYLVNDLTPQFEKVNDSTLADKVRGISMIFNSPDQKRIGLSFCPAAAQQLWRHLDRVLADWKLKALNAIFLIGTDPDRWSDASKKRLKELQKQKVGFVQIDTTLLAGLEALQAILDESRTGKLFLEGQLVSEEQVGEWIGSSLLREAPELKALILEQLGFYQSEELADNVDSARILPMPAASCSK
jgi:hypothetical protein